jgi:hypothetical protein
MMGGANGLREAYVARKTVGAKVSKLLSHHFAQKHVKGQVMPSLTHMCKRAANSDEV